MGDWTLNGREKRRRSFAESVFGLIGHLIGTAVIFVAFFAVAWLVGYALHHLHGIHNFPDEIYKFILRLELWLVYADAALCLLVLLAGAVRFVLDLFGVER